MHAGSPQAFLVATEKDRAKASMREVAEKGDRYAPLVELITNNLNALAPARKQA